MDSTQLTEAQCATLLAKEDGRRQYLEKIYERMVVLGFPDQDPARVAVRNAIMASRSLCYIWADGLGKGRYRRWRARARDWRPI